ncbi:MAG: type II secretion system F family protein [Bryobacter sp.]|jgi:tight adherence protein C|nr:type II secretion system F family protein [Bryobacter sp.]
MALLISALLFLFLLATISVYGYFHFARPGRVYEQLAPASGTTSLGRPPADSGYFGVLHWIEWIGEQVPVSPADVGAMRKRLIMAGYRSDWAAPVIYGVKLVLAALLLLAAISLRIWWTPPGALAIVIPLTAVLAGYFLPNLYLDLLVDRRRTTLRLSLPDALDMLVVCVEAGLGLDQALRNVARELALAHPELCEELNLVSVEMRAGTARSTALQRLAERTGEPELSKLVAVLVQTDRFGTSMADALRTHSDFLRVRRRQEAEERANKIGVKLIFPIFFFILPAMLVVAAGPGVLQIIKQLYPLLRSARL